MTLLALEHLGGDIVRSTANCSLSLAIELELGGKTEITDLNLHLVVKEEIAQLEISMNDAMTVEVLDGGTDLVYVALNFEFVEALASAEQLVEGLVLTQLEQDVDVLGVLEEVFETDDVVLVKGAVNFDFGHQLLLGPCLSQSGLLDNFGSRHSLILEVGELEAASETTFTEEFALKVLLYANFAVVFDDFLFDDGLSTVNAFLWMTLLHFVILLVYFFVQT